ncbi:MAG: helix-turn-helix transcriptional regulator, partial [Pirellulaceae bacterium]
MSDSLLNTRETASRLNISERTLWDLRQSGDIEHVIIGKRSVRYRESEVERFIAESQPSKAGRSN